MFGMFNDLSKLTVKMIFLVETPISAKTEKGTLKLLQRDNKQNTIVTPRK